MHRAESILSAIETTLTGLTTTGANVQRGFLYDINTLPALVIEKGSDDTTGDFGSNNMAFVDRVLEFKVSAIIENTTGLETELNKIAAEVYEAIMAGIGVSYVLNTWLVSDAPPEISAQGETPVALMVMTYNLHYRHSYTSAES